MFRGIMGTLRKDLINKKLQALACDTQGHKQHFVTFHCLHGRDVEGGRRSAS